MCLISRTVGSLAFSREAGAGLAQATWLLAARAGIWRLPGTITIHYKLLIYTGHFWVPAAPGALRAALVILAWVALLGWAGLADLAGWLGWLAALAAGPQHWMLEGCLLG